MSETTKISWCDSTINWWEGCTRISEGCRFCYAEARDKRFTGGKLWGKGAPRRKSKSAVNDAFLFSRKPWICDNCGQSFSIRCQHGIPGRVDKVLNESLRVVESVTPARPCVGKVSYHRRRIFSLSLGDWLDGEVPVEWLSEMLDTIRQCQDVTWILCTKRPELWRIRLVEAYATFANSDMREPGMWLKNWLSGAQPPANIILLASVENQQAADERIPELLRIPAACHGLSLEPLLGPVDIEKSFYRYLNQQDGCSTCDVKMLRDYIQWLIIGGESGLNARPCNVEWIRSLVAQGKATGVATFVKQLGSQWMTKIYDDERDFKSEVKDKKGSDPSEWPSDLRIQQWPKGF